MFSEPARQRIKSALEGGSLLEGQVGTSESVVIQRAEAAFLDIHLPTLPDNAQTRHHRNGQINSEDAGDLPARQYTEDGSQRMEFDTLSHDSRRDDVIFVQSPGDQEDYEYQPVRVCHQ